MTTVAFDGKTFVSDTRMVAEYYTDGSCRKIFDIGNFVVGIAGEYSQCLLFVEEFKNSGTDFNKAFPMSPVSGMTSMIYNKSNKKLYRYEGSGLPMIVKPPYAIGSGAAFAIGAMKFGASAEEAVKIAIKFDINSGLPLNKIEIK